MKRTTKSVFALVIVIAMCFSFCVPTFAAAQGNEPEGHEAVVCPATHNSKADCADWKIIEVVDKECGAAGYTLYECNNCHKQFIDDIKPASQKHEPAPIPGVDATCTTSGKTAGEICSVCGTVTKPQKDIPALGHTPGTPVVTGGACSENGTTTTVKCTVCGEVISETTEPKDDTAHDWVIDFVIDAPSCEHDGLAQMKCANGCGDVKTEVLFKETYAAHNWVDGEITLQPTCSDKGTKTQTCSQCGATQTASVPATGAHQMTGKVNHVDATCTDTGVVGGTYCVLCNDGKAAAETVIPALGHNKQLVSDVELTYDSTCSMLGKNTYKCSRCNQTFEEEVAKKPHSFGTDPTFYQAPTCTTYGYKFYGCTVCGYSTDLEQIEPLGHTPATKKENVVPADCLNDGSYTLVTYCSVAGCGVELLREDNKVEPALGHDIDTTTVAATCVEKGYKYDTCKRCTYVSANYDFTADVDVTNHAFRVESSTAPTCTKNGMEIKFCENCDYYETEVIPALDHDWQEIPGTRVEPECGTRGSVDMECSVCHETETFYILDKEMGHTPATAVKENVVDDTCDTVGSYESVVYCSECGHEISRTPVEVNEIKDHDWTTLPPVETLPCCTNEQGYFTLTCNECGATEVQNSNKKFDINDPTQHVVAGTFVEHYREPGCNNIGIDLYSCSACERTYHVTLEDLRGCENWKTNEQAAVAPDCDDAGRYATYECSSCSKKYYINADGEDVEYTAEEYVIPALGHEWDDATCTDPKTCSVCGATDGTALGHTWDVATCTTAKTCSVCGATDGAPLGHTLKTLAAKAATCTETGLTEGKQCTVCNVVTVKQNVVPKLAHTYVAYAEAHVDATCEQVGYTYVVEKCSCGALNPEYKNGEYLKDYEPATGHNYVYDRTDGLTCLTDGQKIEKCANCGDERNGDVVKCRGYHVNLDGVKLEASCLNLKVADKNHRQCDCGETINAEHNLITVEVPATCTEYSYTLKYCSNADCDEREITNVGTNTLGHKWIDNDNDGWVTTVAPGVLTEGEEQRTCTNPGCGYTETRVVDAEAGIEFVYDIVNVNGGNVIANSNTFNVIISTNAVDSDVFSIALKLSYNTDMIEFVEGNFLNNKFQYSTITDPAKANGYVTILADVVSATAADDLKVNTTLNENGEQFAVLTFKVKDVVDLDKGIVIGVVTGEEDGASTIVDVDGVDVDANFGTGIDYEIVKLGNVAGDGAITIADANKVVEIFKGGEYVAAADIDKNGVVDIDDYFLIRNYLAGNISYDELCAEVA